MLLALALANTLRIHRGRESVSSQRADSLVCADTALRRFAMRSI